MAEELIREGNYEMFVDIEEGSKYDRERYCLINDIASFLSSLESQIRQEVWAEAMVKTEEDANKTCSGALCCRCASNVLDDPRAEAERQTKNL